MPKKSFQKQFKRKTEKFYVIVEGRYENPDDNYGDVFKQIESFSSQELSKFVHDYKTRLNCRFYPVSYDTNKKAEIDIKRNLNDFENKYGFSEAISKVFRVVQEEVENLEIECISTKTHKLRPNLKKIEKLNKEIEERYEEEEKQQKIDFSNKNLNFHGNKKMQKILKEMEGSTIISTGFVSNIEGGMTFDYQKRGEPEIRRVVFGYNDLGEWVEWHGFKDQEIFSNEDK